MLFRSIGKRPVKTKIVGIRPGEKMHEIMVSDEEAHHCVKRGNYFAILPMLPELAGKGAKKPSALSKELSSADSVVDLKSTVALLEKHSLMLDDISSAEWEELLR